LNNRFDNRLYRVNGVEESRNHVTQLTKWSLDFELFRSLSSDSDQMASLGVTSTVITMVTSGRPSSVNTTSSRLATIEMGRQLGSGTPPHFEEGKGDWETVTFLLLAYNISENN